MEFQFNDGGREDANRKGHTGDCVVRAIAIASGLCNTLERPGPGYMQIYVEMMEANRQFAKGRSKAAKALKKRGASPRHGVAPQAYKPWLAKHGWTWTPTMQIGQGCKVHLTDDELPDGRLIVRLSRHLTTVIDGVIHDTYDPQRNAHVTEFGADTTRELKSGEWRTANGIHHVERRCVYGYWKKD